MDATGNGERPAVGAKVCVLCNRDCSTRPRQKDAKGRYHCKECLDKRAAERRAAAAVEPEAPADDGMFDVIVPIAVEPPPPPPSEAQQSRPCPVCGAPLSRKAVICVSCGYNTQTGQKIPGETGKKKRSRAGKCVACGYSLRGLPSGKCPECGTVNEIETSRRQRELEESRAIMRKAYFQPLLMFVIGTAFVCILLAARADTPTEGAAAVITYLIGFGIQLPIGLLVYWLCGVIWIGFDAPLHLIALRLLGIYGVVDAISTGVGAVIGAPLIGSLVACVFYIHLLSEMLDMDLTDAVIVGILTFLAKVLAVITLLVYLI